MYADPESDGLVATALAIPRWGSSAAAGVSLTFDLDGEAEPIAAAMMAGRSPTDRLSRLSGGTYGVKQGLDRVLSVLRKHEVTGTFYIPGLVAEWHPEAVAAIGDNGHEVGHHGYTHRRMTDLDEAAQRAELVDGKRALEAASINVRGYRAPGWELSRVSWGLLGELGFAWDSSLMGADTPYRIAMDGAELVELPVHWTLDDWPYLGFNGDEGSLSDPGVPLNVWLAEYEVAAQERGHVTYTMHPGVIGRRSCIGVLDGLIRELRARDAVFVTHGALYGSLRAATGACD
jgi:peptidoglycan/xylan/chitin deacetylase (PgdA/CDA1 family)